MRDLRFVTAGLSLEAAAEACGVDVRTFRRWETDNRAPLAVQKLLSFLSGELMHLDPQFKGFRLSDGKLFHDQAPYGVTLGDIRAMRWILAERDELRLTLKRLQSTAQASPVPLESPEPAPIHAGAREAVTPRAASGLVSSYTKDTLSPELFIHEARNADIAPSSCIDISSTRGRHAPVLAPKGTPLSSSVYTTKHKPRYGSVGVYRQHKRPEDEARTIDGENRRGAKNPVSTTGRPAWNERLGYAPPAHARKRASLHAASDQGHTAQEAPSAASQAQAPLTHAPSINKGQRSDSERSSATQRNAPASASAAPVLPSLAKQRGMDAEASPRMGEGRGQGLADASTCPAPSAPGHDEAKNTIAHVCSQSAHDGNAIRQQYTLCAVYGVDMAEVVFHKKSLVTSCDKAFLHY